MWMLQHVDLCDKFCETFMGDMNDTEGELIDNIWSRLKQGLLSATEKTHEWTKKDIWRKQTWWWNEKANKDISETRRLQKFWKARASNDKYLDANGKHGMSSTQPRETQKRISLLVLKTIKKIHTENQDVIGEKCI